MTCSYAGERKKKYSVAVYKGRNGDLSNGDLPCWEPNLFHFIHADDRKISNIISKLQYIYVWLTGSLVRSIPKYHSKNKKKKETKEFKNYEIV